MSKQKATLHITLPPWSGKSKRHDWRKEILSRLRERGNETGASFPKGAKVEVNVLVHLVRSRKGAEGQDVDNLLKHILDALQARLGGPKTKRRKGRIIKNDRQVFRAVIEKKYLKKSNESGGQLTVRPYRERP